MTLTALLMLWSLTVPMAIEQRLEGTMGLSMLESGSHRAAPARRSPLLDSAWSSAP